MSPRRHPMLGTPHPRRVGLHHRRHRAQIQRPPTASTFPLGHSPGTAAHTPHTGAAPPNRTHMSNQQRLLFVELDPLDNGLLDPQQPSPYPSVAHADPRL